MKIDTMKAIDHRVGLVICVALDVMERVLRLVRGRTREIGDVSNILVTKYFGMGSILLATPMMEALRRQFPDAKITLFTFERNRPLGELLTCVDEVLSLRTTGFGAFLRDLLVRLWQFRRRKFDLAVDLEFFSKFATIVTYLSGARARIGFQLRSLWRGDLLTHPVYMNQHRHITRDFMAMAEAAGARMGEPTVCTVTPSSAAVAISEEAETRVAELVQDNPRPIVALNPNASELSFERRWPPERFVELAKRLLVQEPQIRLFAVGSEQDRPYVGDIVSQCDGGMTNLAGQLSVEELFSFFRRCDLVVTNDSGPLHMATVMGTPTVSFFGPETPEFYGPLGASGRATVFYKHLYCSPCLSAQNVKTPVCGGNNQCLQAIGGDEVFEAVLAQLRLGEEDGDADD